ncbi:transcription factor grauzone-like isoform X2 [Lucilia sericata]|uniref:transcription factor grauzone-like isoform X2 n=1 Tax=Lucilia sericata TaxID=13632 RepID=UPI0018A8735D|nr:transcription factor grauzone-like isoform X2 [Lucilia sericata]
MLCCVCLLEQSKTLAVFDVTDESLNIAEIVHQHLWFKPTPNHDNPTQICIHCWDKIKDFHDFYQTVEKSHKLFENQTNDIKEEKPNVIKQEQDVFEENLMQVEVEIDVNASGEHGRGEVIKENPLEAERIDEDIALEQESEDDSESSFNYGENSEISEGDESSAEEDKTKDVKSKKGNLEKDNNIEKVAKRKKFNKTEKKTGNSSSKKKWTDKFLDPILTEQMIKKHINMICDLCVFVGASFPDMVSHFKKYHPKVRPYIMCCDRKFTKRYYVAQHALKHEDPNYFRCEQCNKSFTTTCSLRTHNLSYHAPEEELLHSCESCPRKFARRNLLELHRPVHIPKEDWNFFCTKCPTQKAFATAYLLNIHNGMNHKKAANICHVCAKEIKDKHAFEKHVRLHFEDSGPRVKCPYPDCDSWLKDEDNLKSHLQRHNPEGKIYKCPDCGKLCKNRGALTNHKRYSHSNERFQCEQCKKTFKKAISLREHMTQHTGETLYSCPFCTRTFNSNANMHAHKKKQHPNEWKELRRKNIGPLPN